MHFQYKEIGKETYLTLSSLFFPQIAWFTRDWTLMSMWLGVILAFIYFVFGDFFVEDFIDEDEDEDEDKEDK